MKTAQDTLAAAAWRNLISRSPSEVSFANNRAKPRTRARHPTNFSNGMRQHVTTSRIDRRLAAREYFKTLAYNKRTRRPRDLHRLVNCGSGEASRSIVGELITLDLQGDVSALL